MALPMMRKRSRVPESVTVPADEQKVAPSDLASVPEATHTFPVKLLMTKVPCITAAADPVLIPKPVVKDVAVNAGPSVDAPKYPLIVKLDAPI